MCQYELRDKASTGFLQSDYNQSFYLHMGQCKLKIKHYAYKELGLLKKKKLSSFQ